MSRPFLAVDEERRAIQRLRWYMVLRWTGVAVLYSGGVAAREIGQLDYSLTAGNVLAPLVLAYNVVVWRLVTQWERTPPTTGPVPTVCSATCSARSTSWCWPPRSTSQGASRAGR